MRAGVACIDVTPPLGLAMSGFAARTRPAEATHDALTVRALVVDSTAIVVADVIGLDETSCARIRALCPVPHVVVAATHTHGGPAVMPGRLNPAVDPGYLNRLEAVCAEAVHQAAADARPCRLWFGQGGDPGIARNRRHPAGPVDPALPVLRLYADDGSAVAVVVTYACHPTVLGPDNLAWTGDFPNVVRREVEAALPGAVCLFLTGCAGDVSVGHRPAASFSASVAPGRTFAEAERIGRRIAEAALAATLSPQDGAVRAASAEVVLDFSGGEALASLQPWLARVSLLAWAGLRLVALPGEPFAHTGLELRRRLGATLVFAYADGCPGYLPPRHEYPHGGYEVEDAHRYYGMPSPFAPGSVERLEGAVADLIRSLEI